MSFILPVVGMTTVAYVIYKYVNHGTTATAPLFRSPFLQPRDFKLDPVYGEAPTSDYPLPVRQVRPPPPSLMEPDRIESAVLTKID